MIGAIRFYPEPLRSIAAGLIGGGYQPVGSAFAHAIYWIHLVNDTDVALVFSWDGVTDHVFLPSGGFLVMDITANQTKTDLVLFFSVGQKIYVNNVTSDPSTGIVSLSAFYASGG